MNRLYKREVHLRLLKYLPLLEYDLQFCTLLHGNQNLDPVGYMVYYYIAFGWMKELLWCTITHYVKTVTYCFIIIHFYFKLITFDSRFWFNDLPLGYANDDGDRAAFLPQHGPCYWSLLCGHICAAVYLPHYISNN